MGWYKFRLYEYVLFDLFRVSVGKLEGKMLRGR